jgi:hypothetical protein
MQGNERKMLARERGSYANVKLQGEEVEMAFSVM